MLTILGLWLAAQTVLTFVSRVSLQVHRKPVSTCQPKYRCSRLRSVSSLLILQWSGQRISRIRSVARTVSSRRVSGRAMELVKSHAPSDDLSNCTTRCGCSAALGPTNCRESSSCGSSHPYFARNVHALVQVAEIEEASCPTACAMSPMLVGRDRSFRNWSIYQDRSPRRVGLPGPELVPMRQQASAPTKVWESGGDHLEFQLAFRSKMVQDSNPRFGTQQLNHVSNTSQWNQHRSGVGFQHSAASPRTESVAPLSPSPAPKQIGNTACPAVHKRMNGKYLLGVCGGSDVLAKAAKH